MKWMDDVCIGRSFQKWKKDVLECMNMEKGRIYIEYKDCKNVWRMDYEIRNV
jgi:hypothetical protein